MTNPRFLLTGETQYHTIFSVHFKKQQCPAFCLEKNTLPQVTRPTLNDFPPNLHDKGLLLFIRAQNRIRAVCVECDGHKLSATMSNYIHTYR